MSSAHQEKKQQLKKGGSEPSFGSQPGHSAKNAGIKKADQKLDLLILLRREGSRLRLSSFHCPSYTKTYELDYQ